MENRLIIVLYNNHIKNNSGKFPKYREHILGVYDSIELANDAIEKNRIIERCEQKWHLSRMIFSELNVTGLKI